MPLMPRSTKSSAEPTRTTRDAALYPLLNEVRGPRVLCTSLSRGDLPAEIARLHRGVQIDCCFFDAFLAEQAQSAFDRDRFPITVRCEPDFPDGPFDTVAMPFLKNGEAEFTRELLQQAHERLAIGGRLLVSIDNPRDRWLHEQIEQNFDKVTKRAGSRGLLYLATKTKPLKRPRDFMAEFAFRDSGRLVKAVSRPGVFSHRELDLGARALLEATANDNAVQAGMKVLDIGCGSGTVGVALSLRANGVHLHAVDSNPRAIQCTRLTAERNGLTWLAYFPSARRQPSNDASTVSTELEASGNLPKKHSFDLVLANPPYYSNWAIATIFVEAAARALRPGGTLYLVTKHADWYRNNLPFVMSDVAVRTVRGYAIITAKPRG